MTVREFKKRSFENIKNYLMDKYNPSVIKDSEKKFSPENIQHLLNTVGFNWLVLNSYKAALNEVKNVQGILYSFLKFQKTNNLSI